MSWSLVGSDAVGFTDGNAGHIYTIPHGAPSAGDLDIVVVNSDTTVSAPAGFSVAVSAVSNQGAYIFYRIASGTEASTITVTTAGDFTALLTWQRWQGAQALDAATSAQFDANNGGATPAVDTGALAETDELVVVAACLHRFTAEPASPVWSTGYTPLVEGVTGSGNSACKQFVGYRTGAGTADETPSATWTNGAFERYLLVATFEPSAIQAETGTGTIAGMSLASAAGAKASTGTAGAALTSAATGSGAKRGTGAASIGVTSALATVGAKRGSSTPVTAAATTLSAHGSKAVVRTAVIASATSTPTAGAKTAGGTGRITLTAVPVGAGSSGVEPGRAFTGSASATHTYGGGVSWPH